MPNSRKFFITEENVVVKKCMIFVTGDFPSSQLINVKVMADVLRKERGKLPVALMSQKFSEATSRNNNINQ